ncbi:uncharacterized protein LOC141640053 [Silene latifolia]|uniref:uncharacterized protein LOC141640053 n=1 Tax=Silene latifolia TaxID=37657 RepID=UPI003D775D25
MKIATWNIRGFNEPLKQAEVKNFIRTNHIDLLGILETRVKIKNVKKIHNQYFNNYEIFTNYKSHYNGRIWCIWDPVTIQVEELHQDAQHIFCKVKHFATGNVVWVSVVYGFNTGDARYDLWSHLRQASLHQKPLLTLGDFNVVRDINERIGPNPPDLEDIMAFNECIVDAGLEDINGTGCLYTWTNKQESGTRTWSKLDRAMVIVTVFPSLPIKKRFHFLNCWVAEPSYKDLISNRWKEVHYGTPMHIIFSKLKAIKQDLVGLHKNSYSNIGDRVTTARFQLSKCQEALQNLPFSAALLVEEKQLLDNFSKLKKAELSILSQRAKEHTIKHDDCGSEFFFAKIA